jgi:hypothetical protein
MSIAWDYCSAIEQKFNAEGGSHNYTLEVESGRKFDKIIISSNLKGYESLGSKSVFAFVEKETGDLIKAATWKAPAKLKTGWATKYNLNTQFELALEKADPYGGFLYQ